MRIDEKQMWAALFAVSSFLYRVTEQAPERDPLRWHLQDIAVRLLRETSSTMFGGGVDAARPQGVLRELLAVAELLRERTWMAVDTLEVLVKHVRHLRNLFEEQAASSVETTAKRTITKEMPFAKKEQTRRESPQKTSRRQDRILDILGEIDGNTAPASFFAEAFPGITARTIRRDLQTLIGRGQVTQEGNGRGAQYRLREEETVHRAG